MELRLANMAYVVLEQRDEFVNAFNFPSALNDFADFAKFYIKCLGKNILRLNTTQQTH